MCAPSSFYVRGRQLAEGATANQLKLQSLDDVKDLKKLSFAVPTVEAWGSRLKESFQNEKAFFNETVFGGTR
jgi:hypothetical protein